MIFGFNTDIKHEDTVYHVQSEAREGELILQTQVFVRGRCIGKRATSYADKMAAGAFSDQQKEQILRDQHRIVLEAIRFARPDAAPFYAQVLTDAQGNAEMNVKVDEASLPDSSVLVQANHSGRTATRKFRLRAE